MAEHAGELVEHLTELGVGPLEAEVYLAVLRNGPSQAGAIISLTGESRGTVYRVLGELVERGYLRKSLSKPARYRAAEPDELFAAALREVDRDREYIEMLQDRLAGPLGQLAESHAQPVEPDWTMLEGRTAIYERLAEVFDGAEASISVLTNHAISYQPIPAVEKAWRPALERAEEGVTLRELAHRPQPLRDALDAVGDATPVTVQPFEADETLHFVLVDDAEAIYWVVPSDTEGIHQRDDTAVHTDAPGLVHGACTLFETLWSQDPDR